MGSSYEDYAYDQYMADLGHEEELQNAIEAISIENASWYLGTFGDALERRVRGLIDEAKVLAQFGHAGASLVLGVSALELLVRFFVLKPLVSGTFLKDIWVDLLVDRLVSGQSRRDRELMRLIADESEIDFESIRMTDGGAAWSFYESELVPKRNGFVHRGEPVSPELALRSVDCAEALFCGLLSQLAKKLKLSWPTYPWHKSVTASSGRSYEPRDPFE